MFLLSTIASRKGSKRSTELSEKKPVSSQRSTPSSAGERRLGMSRKRIDQNETQRFTELIAAIFKATGGNDMDITVERSLENDTGSLSPEESEELMQLSDRFSESLRWEGCCSDPEEEKERMRTYKINRRKRYLVESLRTRQDKESVLKFARDIAAQCNDAEY